MIGILAAGLVFMGWPQSVRQAVPAGAKDGDLSLEPCRYETEAGSLAADCGTLVVPENRRDPDSELIGLPVVRIRATGADPAEPIFRLEGGPGQTNMSFSTASRLTDRHDVVIVGYRGVDGSVRLDCPEVESALRRSADFAGEESARRYAMAFGDCARRLTREGIDLAGYSLPQRVDDLEAARRALGYDRVNLISESAGTRTAMIYAWRHPRSVHRSAMIAVNPPGRFLWDGKITDEQLRHYATLCAADDACATRTGDLAASMRATAAGMPARWGPLPIKNGHVRAVTMLGMYHASEAAEPLNAPAMIDAWLAAADGDPSAFWALSVLGDLIMPGSFVWGEFAASGIIDAPAVDAHYARGGDQATILGNAAAETLWGGGRMAKTWPASPDYAGYRKVQTSRTETLLISGSVDFSTPARLATDELLPALPNGRQVILAGLGHTTDFWDHRPQAAQRLLTAFFDRGVVDESLFTTHRVNFASGKGAMSTVALILLGTLTGLAAAFLALLGWMVLRVRRRGGLGRRSGVALRVLAAPIAGLGGWSLGVLTVASLWPALFADPRLAVTSIAVAVGLCVHLAWVRRSWPARIRYGGLAAASAASALGSWLGSHAAAGLTGSLTAIAGATLAANLALLVLDIVLDVARGRRTTSPAGDARALRPAAAP